MKLITSHLTVLGLLLGFSPLSLEAKTEAPVYYQRVCHEGKCRYIPIGTAYYIAPEYYDYDPSFLSVPGSWVESIVGVF